MNKCKYCDKPVKNKYCNVSCQNRDQNTERNKNTLNKKYGIFRDYSVKCYKCNTSFIVTEREKKFPTKKKVKSPASANRS